MIVWPKWLPMPKVDLNLDVSVQLLQTKENSGIKHQRARFKRQHRTIKVTFDMNDIQRAAFASVWKYSLNGGSDWFCINLPLETGMVERVVRFQSKGYTEKYSPVLNWTISATLDLQDQVSQLTSAQVAELLALTTTEDFESTLNDMLT